MYIRSGRSEKGLQGGYCCQLGSSLRCPTMMRKFSDVGLSARSQAANITLQGRRDYFRYYTDTERFFTAWRGPSQLPNLEEVEAACLAFVVSGLVVSVPSVVQGSGFGCVACAVFKAQRFHLSLCALISLSHCRSLDRLKSACSSGDVHALGEIVYRFTCCHALQN